jgi:hypothetical protein
MRIDGGASMNYRNSTLVLSALGVALLATPASAQYYYSPPYAPAYTYAPPAYAYVPVPVYPAPAYTYVPAPVYAAPVYVPPPYGYGPGYSVTYVPVYPRY